MGVIYKYGFEHGEGITAHMLPHISASKASMPTAATAAAAVASGLH